METSSFKVAEESTPLSRGSLTERLLYGASEDKERFHRVSGLPELLRKLCFPHVAEQTELQPELPMGNKFYFTGRLSTPLTLLALPFCLFHS